MDNERLFAFAEWKEIGRISAKKRRDLFCATGGIEMISEGELFLRLVLACVLGGIIGYERQSRRKSAGLRTNVLVCLGACLIMVLS